MQPRINRTEVNALKSDARQLMALAASLIQRAEALERAPQPLLTMDEACVELSVTRDQLTAMRRAGRIKGVAISEKVVNFSIEEIEAVKAAWRAESRPSSATRSTPTGVSLVSANSAAPFPVR